MKLRNKKTGAIYSIEDIDLGNNADGIWIGMAHYGSLAELNEEWEDYEEPFSFSFYTIVDGEIRHCIFYRERVAGCPDDAWAYIKDDGRKSIKQLKAVGNYFETREEAEKAVEKLKAWKRLKDNGYKFNGMGVEYDGYKIYLKCDIMKKEHYTPTQDHKDLDLLFGGEE